MNEDFEKWADDNRFQGIYRPIALQGYEARQPEIDALRNELSLRVYGESRAHQRVGMLNKEVAALKAENERLRKDAERYRWLREQHWNEADFAVVCFPKKSVRLGADCPSLLRLDEALDTAMSALPDTKGE